jgi:ribosomal protein S2
MNLSIKLLSLGMHIGHAMQDCMSQDRVNNYIIGTRNNINIININKTVLYIKNMLHFVTGLARSGGSLLYYISNMEDLDMNMRALFVIQARKYKNSIIYLKEIRGIITKFYGSFTSILTRIYNAEHRYILNWSRDIELRDFLITVSKIKRKDMKEREFKNFSYDESEVDEKKMEGKKSLRGTENSGGVFVGMVLKLILFYLNKMKIAHKYPLLLNLFNKKLKLMWRTLVFVKYFNKIFNLSDAVFLIDPRNNYWMKNEFIRLKMPIIGICDTNMDIEDMTYPIPCNDDSAAIWIFFMYLINNVWRRGIVQRYALFAQLTKKKSTQKMSTQKIYNNIGHYVKQKKKSNNKYKPADKHIMQEYEMKRRTQYRSLKASTTVGLSNRKYDLK